MSDVLASLLLRHRAVVCVGTGGVGKTTTAAALGLAAASLGRRTMVLTIDPARQLARALGLETLTRAGEPVDTKGLTAPGMLHAGMLDLKASWDAFITRHAPTTAVRDAMLANPFYQKVSTSFAGTTEFMAIEELCRLDESRAYDLIIIDTPPSGRAIDFLRAPERLEKLLAPEVARWILGRTGGGALQAVTGGARFLIKQLERAMGTRTMSEASGFFTALDAMFGDLSGRATRGRALLTGKETAFLLVVAPTAPELAGAVELTAGLKEMAAPLRGVIANRVHPLPGPRTLETDVLAAAEGDASVTAWLQQTWSAARALADVERERLDAFAKSLPPDVAWVEVPELEHDAHALEDLARLAGLLCSLPARSASAAGR
ncbi:MAG: ArsA-related P-loop ATPase [Myxococcales bacterium]|nr:ArsA-related P-loop ATPase [Myxococcales bacterium]